MPRSGTTKLRTFTYTKPSAPNIVLAELQSATNPENGTVTYTYNGDHTLATKTDAKGQVFTYSYDVYKRLTQVSVGGNVLRTYSYDTNSIDSSYSQYSAGRLTTITYPAINYDVTSNQPQGSTTFTDMFTYSAPGQITGKRLRVNKVQPYPNGNPQTQTAVGDLNLTYSYNAEGKMTSIGYPAAGASYTYSYDGMMRPSGMTDQSNIAVVNNVQYGPANELLSMNMPFLGGTETRTYNSLLQLTSISGLGQNITYTFPSATNNGKISSQTDNLSGETVTYQYDSLNRLISASGSGWSQSQSYDGFGNLTNRTGTGTAQSTTISTPADVTTNRLSGYAYDLNGNLLSTGNLYDAENRLVQANMPGGIVEYGYDAQNKRIWQGNLTNTYCGGWCLSSDTVSLFGIDGKLIGTYTPTADWNNTQTQLTLSFNVVTQRVYFGSKLIGTMNYAGQLSAVVQDRLGSRGKYYPYGEERNSPPLANDQVKFATYTRDSATGLDYADQRYYASTFGRFMTPDPYVASATGAADPSNPGSWNRYTYVLGDPIGFKDPTGLLTYPGDDSNPGPSDPRLSGGGIGGGAIGTICQIITTGVFGFWGSPPPFCPAPAQPPPPPPRPEPPPCFIALQYRPVEVSIETPTGQVLQLFNHAYITVGTQFGNVFVLEGLPQNPNFPWGNLVAHVFVFNGVTVVGDSRDTPLTDPIQGVIDSNSVLACDLVNSLIYDTNNFDQLSGGPHQYGGAISNSNSFASYILYLAGIPFGSPPQTPGWGNFNRPFPPRP